MRCGYFLPAFPFRRGLPDCEGIPDAAKPDGFGRAGENAAMPDPADAAGELQMATSRILLQYPQLRIDFSCTHY